MTQDRPSRPPNRRDILINGARLVGGAGLLLAVAHSPARATPEAMREAMKKVIGDAPVRKGRVKLELPPLIENGNSVSMTVAVDSPMTSEDYVKSIHVFNEKNPQPNVISVYIGPRAGRATVATRIRLADSQQVTAIAEMSDGTYWSDEVDVIVTLAACLEVL